MIDRLTRTLDFQTQALVLRAERQRIIASNIANADTPGYQARDFDFAQALRQATAGSAAGAGAGNGLGSPVFDGADTAAAGGEHAAVELAYARPAQANLDGNSVDMDRERAAFADNALKYEAVLRFINGQVRTLSDAMKSPNQA